MKADILNGYSGWVLSRDLQLRQCAVDMRHQNGVFNYPRQITSRHSLNQVDLALIQIKGTSAKVLIFYITVIGKGERA